ATTAPPLKLDCAGPTHQPPPENTAALIGLALGANFSAPLADWLGRKKIIINSDFIYGFWNIATAFSHNEEQRIYFR
ncbi:aromatic acid/H+ symport family MFS transporter, partial [Klebsiella pneumoniae]|nr:aromatic acid/H+ symport family MFS transporter [Klebsiella pneumoniae]